jgi:DNA-binding SARP family transcriptional activator
MLRIELAGRLSVLAEDGTLLTARDFPGRQGRLAFARLVTADGPVPAEVLADLLWPDRPPNTWRRDLAAVVSKLRALLARVGVNGRQVLRHEGGCYELVRPVVVVRIDVEEADAALTAAKRALAGGDLAAADRAATSAAEIARRQFLPGEAGEWVDQQCGRLEDLLLGALDVRAASAPAAEAVRCATEAVAVRPLREVGHLHLIRAHLRNGSRSEALRAHARCRQLLRAELGVEPMPAIAEAFMEALATVDENSTRVTVPLPWPLRAPDAGQFVGRSAELAALGQLLHAEGVARVAHLVGPAGVGKTGLAAALGRAAHREGAVVLAGRCDQDPARPFLPFAQALGHLVRHLPPALVTTLAAGWDDDLAKIVPDLVPLAWPDGEGPGAGRWPGLEAAASRYRLFEAVTAVLARLTAHAPAVLVIDDVHRAGHSTIDLLHHIVVSGRAPRLLVVSTGRPWRAMSGQGPEARLVDLERSGHLVVIPVRPLEVSDVATLLGGHAELAEDVHRVTAGNALFAVQLARHLSDTGVSTLTEAGLPSGIAAVIRARFGLLDDVTWRVLCAAAVAGPRFSVPLLARVTGLPEARTSQVLERSRAAGLLHELDDEFCFAHDIVRMALIEQLGAPRREALHRAVGEAIEATAPWSSQALAGHFLAAGASTRDKALRYCVLTAQAAAEATAHGEAARFYRDAVRASAHVGPSRRGALLLALATEQLHGGDPSAADTFHEAARTARHAGDPRLLARCAIGMADRWAPTGSMARDTVHLLSEALEALPDDADLLRATVLARLASTRRWEAAPGPRRQLGHQAVSVARQAGDPAVLAECLDAQTAADWGPGEADERRRAGHEIVDLAHRASRPELALRGHAWGIIASLETADRPGLDTELAAYQELARFLRQPRYLWYAHSREAMRAIMTGDYQRGSGLAQHGRDIARQAGEADADNLYAAVMFPVWFAHAGRDHRSAITTAIQAAADQPAKDTLTCAAHLLAAAAAGQPHTAYRASTQRLLHLTQAPRTMHWLFNTVTLAAAAAHQHDVATAERLHPILLPYENTTVIWAGAAAFFGAVSHWLGILETTLHDLDSARRHLDTASKIHTDLGAPAWIKRSQDALATLPSASTQPTAEHRART